MVININAENLELEENDDGSKIVNIKAGNDEQQILEEEEFIPDYEDYEDYDDDDDIGVVSLRWVCKDTYGCLIHLCVPPVLKRY